MYHQKKPRDYKSLWIISMFILAIGIVLTINLAMIRPVGFVLLGVGGFGLVWSLTNMDKWKDKKDKDDQRRFN
ncbi:MAG: hypothetical protein DRI98_11760 [Bacteroidetes bacterium]|nr:MAG: hypothetical protein DRI98_11760 [Bacteroidota bacterium]